MGGRKKKRRVAPAQDEEAARRRFLEALEAQRANARGQKPETTAEAPASAPARAAPLPGFYYDEAKRRYFRASPASERRQREKLQLQEQKQPVAVQKEAKTTKNRRGHGLHCHSWVAYMAQRQSDYSWSARGRDRRELIPKWLSGVLSSQMVEAQDVENVGRLTALALHPLSSNLGAIGASGGRLDLLRLNRLPPGPGMTSSSPQVQSMTEFSVSGVITSLHWRPVHEVDLLLCHLGAGNGSRGNTRAATGSVCILRVGGHDQGRILSNSSVKELYFDDPWTAKWNPVEVNKFSVGCGGRVTALHVNERGQLQFAPQGLISDAVHAQGFYSTGQVLLNGTKSGGLWGWDLRVKRRIYEWKAEATADQAPGTVLDIHVLDDCSKAVVQRSSGELRLIDLRMNQPVVEFIPGAAQRYSPHLRCDIDSQESVVVAGGDMQHPHAVNTYDLQTGRCIASLGVGNNQRLVTSEKRPTLVQQVKLGYGAGVYRHIPEIWALSRNELYTCTGRPTTTE
ncbi:DDB1- and CUL4-associated factor 4 [Phytophthora ramorum]